MNAWRLIESPPSDIFSQMNLDRELFEEAVRDPSLPPLLRIYRVCEPAVTVGCSYPKKRSLFLELKNLFFFWKKKRPLCIRPTGGGWVEHGNDLIYSVIARRNSFPTFGRVRTSYLSFHEAVQEAFLGLKIKTHLFRCDEVDIKKAGRSRRIGDCFREPVATDVGKGEQKVAGGAQWRRREAFLHQGSIQIPPGVSFDDLKAVLIGSFERKFAVVWQKN